MTKADLIDLLEDAGVEYDKRWGKARLEGVVMEHGLLSPPEPTAPPVADGDIRAECVWSNVWTLEGRLMRGDVATLGADEFNQLRSIGAVKET